MAKEQEAEFSTQSWYIPRDPKKNPADGISTPASTPGAAADNDSLISGGNESLTSNESADSEHVSLSSNLNSADSSAPIDGDNPYPASYLPRESEGDSALASTKSTPNSTAEKLFEQEKAPLSTSADQSLPIISESVVEDEGPAWDAFYGKSSSQENHDNAENKQVDSQELPDSYQARNSYENTDPIRESSTDTLDENLPSETLTESTTDSRSSENTSTSTQELPVTPSLDEAMTGPAPSDYARHQHRNSEESTTQQRVSLLQDYHKDKQGPQTDPNLTPTWNTFPSEQEEALLASSPKVSLDEAIFEGATVTPTVPSRLTAHLWSALLYLLLVPLTWYYCVDASTRLSQSEISPWLGGAFTTEVRVELGVAAVAVLVLFWIARYSSVGPFLLGGLSTLISLPYFIVPGRTHAIVAPFLKALAGGDDPKTLIEITRLNLAHHLEISFSYGLFLWLGLILIGVGIVSHGARRKGRKDYLLEEKIERANLA